MTTPPKRFHLITGRTIKQAQGMHKGKTTQTYRDATARLEMSQADMEEIGFSKGDRVRVISQCGEALVTVSPGDLPAGVIFMPMGQAANRLVIGQTNSTGMPPFKSMLVEISPS